MANMSYCRFQNTLLALQDCNGWLEESELHELSLDEARAAARLIDLCEEITDEQGSTGRANLKNPTGMDTANALRAMIAEGEIT